MSTHKIGFYEDLTKISLKYHQISSNTHLISSAAQLNIGLTLNGWLKGIRLPHAKSEGYDQTRRMPGLV